MEIGCLLRAEEKRRCFNIIERQNRFFLFIDGALSLSRCLNKGRADYRINVNRCDLFMIMIMTMTGRVDFDIAQKLKGAAS